MVSQHAPTKGVKLKLCDNTREKHSSFGICAAEASTNTAALEIHLFTNDLCSHTEEQIQGGLNAQGSEGDFSNGENQSESKE